MPSSPSKPRTPACVRAPAGVLTSKKTCPPRDALPSARAPARSSARHAEGGRTILSSARARMPFRTAASLRTPTRAASHATPSLFASTRSRATRASASRWRCSSRSRFSASSRSRLRASAVAAARRSSACFRRSSALRASCSRFSFSAAPFRNIARRERGRAPCRSEARRDLKTRVCIAPKGTKRRGFIIT